MPLIANEIPVAARRVNLSGSSGIDGIDRLIESAINLCTLQKRVAYLIASVDWSQCYKVRKNVFVKPMLSAACSEKALLITVKLVQKR